eukprot:EG_transcript_6067
MPSGLQLLHSRAPPTLRGAVCSIESPPGSPAILQADPLAYPNLTRRRELARLLWGDNGHRSAPPTPLLGPAIPPERRLSDDSSNGTSDSGLSYTHSPYSFGGPTYFPLSPASSARSSPWPSTPCGEATALGSHVADPSCSVPGCDAHRLRPRLGESPTLRPTPGLLPLPPPLRAPLPPPRSPPTTTISPGPRAAPVVPAHALEGGRCPCATCASAPASPDCGHPRPWRRLRAKRGFTFYACRDCGTKWRAVTPSRLVALEVERDP